MERAISVEERIRRAEEIYEKRRQGANRPITKVPVNNQKKDVKLLKKMIIQILVCISIYMGIYAIYNNKYVFSEDFIKKANEILSYDTNFKELYDNTRNRFQAWFSTTNNEETNQEQQENTEQNGIGGASEEIGQENVIENEQVQLTEEEQAKIDAEKKAAGIEEETDDSEESAITDQDAGYYLYRVRINDSKYELIGMTQFEERHSNYVYKK